MAADLRESNLIVNGKADYVSDQLDNGYLRIYDGTRALTADTAVGAQVLLAELRFNGTAAPAAVDGVLTFNAITADATANNTGTATWFRALKSDGTSAAFDGTVGTSDSDLILNTTSIVSGAEVSVSSFTYTQPK
jgi:hypothetical protein